MNPFLAIKTYGGFIEIFYKYKFCVKIVKHAVFINKNSSTIKTLRVSFRIYNISKCPKFKCAGFVAESWHMELLKIKTCKIKFHRF